MGVYKNCVKYHNYSVITLILIILTLPFESRGNGNGNGNGTVIPENTSHVYTFASSNSFIEIEANDVWNINNPREVSFDFRTDRPHGLLLYHTLEPIKGFPIYELYVIIENGQLKVIHALGPDEETLHIGQGLNHDKFHNVKVSINPTNGKLIASLDSLHEETITLKSLGNFIEKSKGVNLNSFLYFGGTDQKKPISHQQYITPRFIGCLGIIKFGINSKFNLFESKIYHKSNFVLIKKHQNLQVSCVNKCKKLDLCAHNSRCINHYTYTSCDCFGSGHEDWHCRAHNITTLTLRGYSYVSYKIYDYKDRVHSDVNRIGFHFKTQLNDAILVYASGEQPKHNFIAITLNNGKLHFEMNLGDGSVITFFDNISLSDNKWHNVTVKHHGNKIDIILDKHMSKELKFPGHHHHLHVDPDVFFGGISAARFENRIRELNIPFDVRWKFVGCLKFVYFNRINILYELHNGNKASHHHSVFPPEFGCYTIDPIPITFATKKSHFLFNIPQTNRLKLSLEFKTEQKNASIASGNVKFSNSTNGNWFLTLRNGFASFSLRSNSTAQREWNITNNIMYLTNYWQHISIDSRDDGTIEIMSNYKTIKTTRITNSRLEFYGNVSFGFPQLMSKNDIGFRGCLRDITINNNYIDSRIAVNKRAFVFGKVSLDNCQLVNSCDSPNACEHNGKCIASPETGDIKCDCEKTGYLGETCHFSLFRRTCEELYLLGYRNTGTYVIDIDRNGPLPPAHVICVMPKEDGPIQTIIEHNIRREMVVREGGREGNYYINVTYREFTPKMLNSLIIHSKQCSQYIRYDCRNAPLRLSSNTWMQSQYPNHHVTSIGSEISGRCRCSTAMNCADSSKYCNCDSDSSHWLNDDGVFTNPKDVGITRLFFIQPKNLTKDTSAHLFLGNVSCTDSNTREYEITFKTKESYLEVPGWESGDMAISFRTTASKAVLFYQAPLHSHHNYIKAILSSETEITFEFSVHGNHRSKTVKSKRKLNTGEWQQVWVDRDAHHMRFTVNLNSELIDLDDDYEFNEFEGPLYVGGAPRTLLQNSEVRTGFIGCLRGLVINDNVINLHQYMYRKAANIETGCRPSCQSDLCKNGGKCVELWGSYECRCANPIAHSGRNCENNMNDNGMTFITPSSYVTRVDIEGNGLNSIFEKEILISFRTYMSDALILYANDYRNNFVQLHIENGSHVVFTYNSYDKIVRGAVHVGDSVTSGDGIQVKVDRSQRSKTILTVNSKSVIINYPINLLTKYSQKPWISGEEFEMVKPARPPVPIEVHSQLFLGGVDGIGVSSKINGIVGCLRGVVFDGKPFDLEKEVKHMNKTDQIIPGCSMLCDQKPCANNGICHEDWKNRKIVCNCSMTSYYGEMCNKDVGARFNGNSLVKYNFTSGNSELLENVTIHLAFSTQRTSSTITRIILLVHHSEKSAFIQLLLNPDGSLLFEENILNEATKYRITNESSYADGYRHSLSYKRRGKNHQLRIDGKLYEGIPKKETTVNVENNGNIVYVGGVERSSEDFNNFDGCISNILLELNTVRIEPLESAFEGKGLVNVFVNGDIKLSKCAEFKPPLPVMQSSVVADLPKLQISLDEEWITPVTPQLVPFKLSSNVPETAGKVNRLTVFIICISFLIIVILAVTIYMWKLQKTYKIKQFRGDTPFFNSKRNSSVRVTFNLRDNDDSEAAVKLLQHQQLNPTNTSFESHPLKESRIRFLDENSGENKDDTKVTGEKIEETDKVVNENEKSPPPLTTNGRPNLVYSSIRNSYAHELQWDPDTENNELSDHVSASEADLLNEKKHVSKAPLATMSEFTINLLLPTNSSFALHESNNIAHH